MRRLRDVHLRFDDGLKARLEAYAERESLRPAIAVRRLLEKALDDDEGARREADSEAAASRLEVHAEAGTIRALIREIRQDVESARRFAERVALSAMSTRRLLVHWAAQTRAADPEFEDRLLEDLDRVGEEEVERLLRDMALGTERAVHERVTTCSSVRPDEDATRGSNSF
jgi:hypothetical protein